MSSHTGEAVCSAEASE